MKYVFFDIECACVYKYTAKICAFGYTVTDENYNVLIKEDILINPKGKFHLTDRKGSDGIELPYEYDKFKAFPAFPAVYGKIKALLEDPEAIVLGHATHNDVNYLNLETKRYKLPSFRFCYHDTQFFYMNTENDFTRQCGLGTMAQQLGVEFVPHRAADDAYATMRVCEALCKREGADVKGLCERYKVRSGKISSYKIFQPDSEGLRAYYKKRDEEHKKRAEARENFFNFVNKNNYRKKRSGINSGKRFCFSKEIENNVPFSVELAGAVFASGGRYTSRPQDCDVYIAEEEGGKRYLNAVENGAKFVPLSDAAQSIERGLELL